MPDIPKHDFSLEPGRPKRLGIAWLYRQPISVWFDGTLLNHPQPGEEFSLPDGSILLIKEGGQKALWGTMRELQIIRNGQLIGAIPMPSLEIRLKNAYGLIFLAAILQLLRVPISVLESGFDLRSIGLGIIGVILLALFFLAKARSKPLLICAIVISILIFESYGIQGLYQAIQRGAIIDSILSGIWVLTIPWGILIGTMPGVMALDILKRK